MKKNLRFFEEKIDQKFYLNYFIIYSSILLKAIKECSDDIANFIKTFNSLENDFVNIHLPFMRELKNALRVCQHVDAIVQFLEVFFFNFLLFFCI